MRLKITLQTPEKVERNIIPISYQYELSAWIYNVINRGDPGFSKWLFSRGYIATGKSFKLFTFSRLQIPKDQFQIREDRLILKNGCVSLYISLLLDHAALPFVMALFRDEEMFIGDRTSRTDFRVRNVECISEPEFQETMIFRTLSPIVINQYDLKRGKFLSPDNPEYEAHFFQNLVSKYCAVKEIGFEKVEPEAHNPEVVSKFELISIPTSIIVTIKAGTAQETNVRGFMYDFKLRCPVALIRTGYHAGFGEKNNMGFGCTEVL